MAYYKEELEVRLHPDTEIPLENGISYMCLSSHRRVSQNKSRWVISLEYEVNCFRTALEKNWFDTLNGWGLHLQNMLHPEILGETARRGISKIAKFVGDTAAKSWHGYPADYQRNIQDRPPASILELWYTEDIIQKHKMAKIMRGQPCSL